MSDEESGAPAAKRPRRALPEPDDVDDPNEDKNEDDAGFAIAPVPGCRLWVKIEDQSMLLKFMSALSATSKLTQMLVVRRPKDPQEPRLFAQMLERSFLFDALGDDFEGLMVSIMSDKSEEKSTAGAGVATAVFMKLQGEVFVDPAQEADLKESDFKWQFNSETFAALVQTCNENLIPIVFQHPETAWISIAPRAAGRAANEIGGVCAFSDADSRPFDVGAEASDEGCWTIEVALGFFRSCMLDGEDNVVTLSLGRELDGPRTFLLAQTSHVNGITRELAFQTEDDAQNLVFAEAPRLRKRKRQETPAVERKPWPKEVKLGLCQSFSVKELKLIPKQFPSGDMVMFRMMPGLPLIVCQSSQNNKFFNCRMIPPIDDVVVPEPRRWTWIRDDEPTPK